MADFVIGAASLQFAADAGQALRPAATSAVRPNAADVPDALEAERALGGVPLNTAAARTAVGAALIAGFGILSALEALRGAFRLAADSGLSGSLTALNYDGTRLSGVTLTSQGNRLVKSIDDLVESAETNGANLISSRSLRVTIQTTQFGGRITVSPQPLDSAGLGLTDLNGVTREDALVALARIETAIGLARSRLSNLEVLEDSLTPGRGLSSELTRIINSGPTGALPRGSLVNQVA